MADLDRILLHPGIGPRKQRSNDHLQSDLRKLEARLVQQGVPANNRVYLVDGDKFDPGVSRMCRSIGYGFGQDSFYTTNGDMVKEVPIGKSADELDDDDVRFIHRKIVGVKPSQQMILRLRDIAREYKIAGSDIGKRVVYVHKLNGLDDPEILDRFHLDGPEVLEGILAEVEPFYRLFVDALQGALESERGRKALYGESEPLGRQEFRQRLASHIGGELGSPFFEAEEVKSTMERAYRKYAPTGQTT